MQQFLKDCPRFMESTGASLEMQYQLARDLAKRMDLPFYKSHYKTGIPAKLSSGGGREGVLWVMYERLSSDE